MNMWEDIEDELSKLTGQYVAIDHSEDYWRVFIDCDCVRVPQNLYQQHKDTQNYIIDEVKKEFPEYFL